MALAKIDKSSELFNVGDILTHQAYNTTYALKLLKLVYISEIGGYRWVAMTSKVKDNEFVANAYVNLAVYSDKELRSEYTDKWTKDVAKTYSAGTILKDQDGVLFLVASDERVWNLAKGTQTTAVRWQTAGADWAGRKFTEVKTAGGKSFSKVIEVKDIKSGW